MPETIGGNVITEECRCPLLSNGFVHAPECIISVMAGRDSSLIKRKA